MAERREPNESLQVDVIVDDDLSLPVPIAGITEAVAAAARFALCTAGEIGIRVTDDPSIQQINRDHLGHDYPTDVISFGYQFDPPRVEGELVVSVDTARRRAEELAWTTANELMLYVVHGTLHLCGMDDHDSVDRAQMRQAETEIMLQLGISDIHRYGADCERPAVEEQT